MSSIFDAIQKAELEQPGTEIVGGNEATELLEQMERRTTSRWESEALSPDVHSVRLQHGGGSLLAMEIVAEEANPEANPEDPASSDLAYNLLLNDQPKQSILQQCEVLEGSVLSQSRIVLLSEAEHPATEAYRLLALRLRDLRRSREFKKLLITSGSPQEGKSLTAANLACALAEDGRQTVLLLEGDLRRPALSRSFGIENRSGMSDWLQGKAEISTCVYRLRKPGFWIMPAGKSPGNYLEVLQSSKLTTLFDEVQTLFDWIVIDAPPVLPLVDTSLWTQFVDGILLVARQGIAQKRQLRQSIKALPSEKLIGALVNCASSQTHYTHDYYRTLGAEQRSVSMAG